MLFDDGGHLGENTGVMGRFFIESIGFLAIYFLLQSSGVQEILNRMFHKDLKGANQHEGFVLLSVFSR
jgi:hypothetical protein